MRWVGMLWSKKDDLFFDNRKKAGRSGKTPRFSFKFKSVLLISALALFASSALGLYYGQTLKPSRPSTNQSEVALAEPDSQSAEETPDVSARLEDGAEPVEQVVVVENTVSKGEAMFDILKDAGVPPQEAIEAITKARPAYNLAKINVGRPYRIEMSNSGSLQKLQYEIDYARTLLLDRQGEKFGVNIREEILDTHIETVKGTVNSSLFDALVNAGEAPYLALEMAKIFAWDIDFSTDLRSGDTFRFAVEKKYKGGQFVNYGKVTIAEIQNDGRTHRAVYFDDGKDASGYYAPDGKAMKKQFLKSPLKYTRISSGYTKSRFHPILKRYMPHQGIDYAAPKGTPVVSVADGVVTWAKRKGLNGNFVVIKHPSGYKSSYGHLSGYAKNIRSQVRVKQGQVVGYVGSTGLATGPHLDFRMKQYDKYLNPLTLKSVQADPLGPKQLALFKKIVKERLSALDADEVQLASREEGPAPTRAY